MGSNPGQSTWDMWWTKWHWNRVLPRVLRILSCQRHSTKANTDQFICFRRYTVLAIDGIFK